MSNRFHTKFHRHNHHTEQTTNPPGRYPDSSYDPIASRQSPFKGEFYSIGQITTTQALSAGGNVIGLNLIAANDLIVENDANLKGTTIIENLNAEGIQIVSPEVFSASTFTNLVSALQIVVNGETLYLPLLSAYN